MSSAEEDDKELSLPYGLAAAFLWAVSVLAHDWGTGLVRAYFYWAERPGVLHPEGGPAGFVRGEQLLAGLCVLALVGLVGFGLRGTRRPLPDGLGSVALAWAIWLALVYIFWQAFVVFASELVHLVQYALIGMLAALAWGRGRRLQRAFLLVVLLGCLDEVWQHYGLHRWLLDDHRHWLDWADMSFNAVGAAGGMLLLATRRHLQGRSEVESSRLLWIWAAAAALALLPLLLLDPVATTRFLGHYPVYPTWNEFANDKAVHWPGPRQGIPLFLATLLLAGSLAGPLGRAFGPGVAAVVLGLGAVALDPPLRREGQPVHEEVASTRVMVLPPGQAIAVDGVLDEAAWASAERLGPFGDIRTGAAELVLEADGGQERLPLQPTYARLLWDEKALYLGFEVADRDIWARARGRDGPSERGDEGLFVFIDDGDEITYYAFYVTPLNVVGDYFSMIPTAPMDSDPWNPHLGLLQWDARGLQTAVRVDGTVDLVEDWMEKPYEDVDRGYTAEMVIPWENFRTTSTPSGASIRRQDSPVAGQRWRLGLYRNEFPRWRRDAATDSQTVDRAEARRRLGVDAAGLQRLIDRGRLTPVAGGERFTLKDVLWQRMSQRRVVQAWNPVFTEYFHHPEHYGVMEFVISE